MYDKCRPLSIPVIYVMVLNKLTHILSLNMYYYKLHPTCSKYQYIPGVTDKPTDHHHPGHLAKIAYKYLIHM